VYNEGQLRQFSKQLRMQKFQAVFNALAAEHRDEIMQMRRERNRAGLQELQDKLAAEAES
jgi:peptidyl-prolyl cis-trans isomerase B (cyclophilin B)